MITKIYTRGNIVEVLAEPLSASGTPVTPDSATVTITYPARAGGQVQIDIPMTQDGNIWIAEWDTTPSARGKVEGSVVTVNPQSSEDFQFYVKANASNP